MGQLVFAIAVGLLVAYATWEIRYRRRAKEKSEPFRMNPRLKREIDRHSRDHE